MYAITRNERRPGIGYWAVLFRRQGKPYYKSFYDFRRGGSKNALAAAIEWRDAQLLALQALSKRDFCELKRTTNRSGAPGVHKIWPKNMPRGCWQARLRLSDGKMRTQTFSIQKFGERAAFELAVNARQRLLQLVEDKPFLHHRVAKKFAAQYSAES